MVHTNRLADEKSPYLLEHAHDPVDWHPWGDEAFELAKKQDKPIFLSIGYSTCHWCHVMQHESFRDEKVAEMLNKTFVCIKVDREQRPDIDRIYIKVAQSITGRAGWPLTIFMTPDKRPFFAATYIPKEDKYGMLGLKALTAKIDGAWKTNREALERDANRVVTALASREDAVKPTKRDLDYSVMDAAFSQLAAAFDYAHGGFSSAPKFPMPSYLTFLLRYWYINKTSDAQQMAEKTLQSIRRGGIYDQLGYGLHRYSTDMRWFAPHFEKMLYDQALIASVCMELSQATKKKDYVIMADEILTFITRDLRSPEGGFYTGVDADSEGEEGRFYLWREDDIERVLHDDEAAIAIEFFGVERNGNYNTGPSDREGTNILYVAESPNDISERYQISPEEARRRIDTIKKKLFAAREKRVRPKIDDKILADMNGLAISVLAKMGKLAERVGYAQAAEDAAEFVLSKMMKKGRLYHSYKDGVASVDAFIDDYAFLIAGFIDLYGTTFEVRHIKTAIELTEEMITHFWDKKNGGFFYTSDYAETVLFRDKESYDGVVPSGNAIAILDLIRLARITGDERYEELAHKGLKAFSHSVMKDPLEHTAMLASLAFALGPSYEIVISGDPGSEDTKEMFRAIRKEFIPNKVVLLRTKDLPEVAPYTKGMDGIDGKATAYICTGHECEEPVTRVDNVLERLGVAFLQ